MRIAKVEAVAVELPFKEGFRSRMNVRASKSVLVKVRSDDGLLGYGCATSVPRYLGATQGTLLEALAFLAQEVEGLDPFDLERIHTTMDRALASNWAAKAAIDMAIYDLLGKALGRPSNSLLGGLYRESFHTDFNLGMKYIDEPEAMAKVAAKAKEEGFRALEVKVGTGLQRDLERIRAIRRAVGDDVLLIADANRAWGVKEAIESIGALQGFHNIIFEEPVGGVEELKEVKSSVGAPICADESCHSLEDAKLLIAERAVDLICIKLMKCGGLLKAKKMAIAAEVAGMACRIDGVPGESKLSNTAAAHLALSLPNLLPVGSGVAQHHYTLQEDIGEGGLLLERGEVKISQEPGFGFRLKGGLA